MADFEILMVSVDWEAPDKIRAVIPAKRNLEVSLISERKIKEKDLELTEYKYESDIVLYHKEDGLYFQFAIKTKFEPYIKNIDESWSKLYQVKDDLWINKGKWEKSSRGIGYHSCQSINTSGKIQLGFRDAKRNLYYISIDLNSNIEGFDFEQLKSDFEGELWELITAKKSKVAVDKINYSFGNRIIRFPENKLIIDFINTFQQIKNNHKHELISSSENRKIEKVKPNIETYRKISISGVSKILPSKAVSENYDVYENRVICAMLIRIYIIVKNNTKIISSQIGKLNRDIENHLDKIKLLEDPDPKVNIENVKLEIEFQKERVNQIYEKWININKNLIYDPKSNFEIKSIVLGDDFWNLRYTYFVKNAKFNDVLITFPNAINKYIEPQNLYVIEGVFVPKDDFKTNKGKVFKRYEITEIRKIEIADFNDKNILKRQESNYETFVANNYSQKSIMDDKEKFKFETERKQQITTLKNNVNQINSKIKDIQDFYDEQIALMPQIERQTRSVFFTKVKWKSFSCLKPSMTFIQNTNYRNALQCYNEILKSEGIDVEVFDLYENITSYGIRELPLVYELWCLITLIRILESDFNFFVEKEDLRSLLKKIDPKNQKTDIYVNFKFHQKFAGREVILHYQKKLDDGRRPDFILEISYEMRKIHLVLDSKFKNYNFKQNIIYETLDMYSKYGKTPEYYVFVLHPCKDGVYENRIVKYTNLGGERLNYKVDGKDKQEFPFHEYGFVECKPNSTDYLKKLIGMGFEYLIESNKNAKKDKYVDPKPEFPLFCISCGNEEVDIKTNFRGRDRDRFYYICSCSNPECGLVSHVDYCWNCRTKLFKHGSTWDYHSESSNNSMDIRCPNCGMTMGDMPK